MTTETTHKVDARFATVEEIVERHIVNALDSMDDDDLLSVYRDVNSYDGSFDFVETYDIEDLGDLMSAYELARAIIYGDVNNVIDEVRFNGYGNLESVSEYELIDNARNYYITDLAHWFLHDYNSYLDVPDACAEAEINRAIDLYSRVGDCDTTAYAVCKALDKIA